MKKNNRLSERALHHMELWGALAARHGHPYDAEQARRLWKTLLLNQFHDILPGSAIAWVHREARADYARDIKRLEMIADSACAVLRCARPDAPVLERARITEYRVDGNAWRAVPAEPVAGMQVSLTHTATGGVILSNGLVETVIEPDAPFHL